MYRRAATLGGLVLCIFLVYAPFSGAEENINLKRWLGIKNDFRSICRVYFKDDLVIRGCQDEDESNLDQLYDSLFQRMDSFGLRAGTVTFSLTHKDDRGKRKVGPRLTSSHRLPGTNTRIVLGAEIPLTPQGFGTPYLSLKIPF
jgi:hypothetical protein